MKKYLFVVMLGAAGTAAAQQHDHHTTPSAPAADTSRRGNHEQMDHSTMDHSKMDHSKMEHGAGSMDHSGMHTGGSMSHLYSRNLPMSRNASGTAWLPDQTPMYMNMWHRSKWMYMLHYAVYIRLTNQNFNNRSKRGSEAEFNAPNWFMGMAQRTVGRRGLFSVKAMVSLDPLTVSPNGYPLVFQSGETYKGQRLIDRQHQHDLISELSVGYAHAFSKDADAFVYLGFPGEPALGPPAFMHRISSFNNPDSPLGHHWQDATHITYGVATAGFRYKIAKLEVSSFTGREPNENRLGFDRPRFDSYSYRVSVNPTSSLAFQFSQGWLTAPEALEPDEDVVRTTASVLHGVSMGRPDVYLSSALVWGQNNSHGHLDNSFLVETTLQLNRVAFYGRFENIAKSAGELGLEDALPGRHGLMINNLTLGTNYRLLRFASTDLVLGAQLTGAKPEAALEPIYGKTPLSGQVYLRINPAFMPLTR
ncbi:hypothetical protein [Tellurirhabdus rosea]|uniref:hypothetical protein n=1 Tax=Tellurirhabdus rosea TaxID=2674997 RepID=UPI00225100F0|nr:hypothetical protein [Tellurirhabdus rosea]